MRTATLCIFALVALATAEMALDNNFIRQLNRDPDLPWVAGRNEYFEGHTLQDAKVLLGAQLQYTEPWERTDMEVRTSEDYDISDDAIPTEFNALTQWPGAIHPIRNQQHCGSCWAFSAAEVLSDRFTIATNKTVDVVLSPQDMVSCDKADNGCGGGTLPFAWSYLQGTGIVKDSCFPYASGTGSAVQCPSKCVDSESWTKYKAKSGYALTDEAAIQKDLMTNGPVQTGFMVYKSFMTYKSGVYKKSWLEFSPLGGHAVKIVGWGVENNKKYWLVANSWGTAWGLQGFFKILRGVNECGLEKNSYAGLPNTSSGEDRFW